MLGAGPDLLDETPLLDLKPDRCEPAPAGAAASWPISETRVGTVVTRAGAIGLSAGAAGLFGELRRIRTSPFECAHRTMLRIAQGSTATERLPATSAPPAASPRSPPAPCRLPSELAGGSGATPVVARHHVHHAGETPPAPPAGSLNCWTVMPSASKAIAAARAILHGRRARRGRSPRAETSRMLRAGAFGNHSACGRHSAA